MISVIYMYIMQFVYGEKIRRWMGYGLLTSVEYFIDACSCELTHNNLQHVKLLTVEELETILKL